MSAIKKGIICAIKFYPEHPDWTDRFVTVVAEPEWGIVWCVNTGEDLYGCFALVTAEWMPIDERWGAQWAIEPQYLQPINGPDIDLSEDIRQPEEVTA